MKIYPITVPGGSDTYVQYNNGGIFGGDSSFTFDDATGNVTMGNSVYIGEQASEEADRDGFGQLWVNNETPNELWFTTDSGVDIQLTNNTGIAAEGLDTEVMYNNGGILDGDSTFNFNDTTKVVDMDGLTCTGSLTYGIDLSSGTWANGAMNWDADPDIYANGTRVFTIDDTNYNLFMGTGAGEGFTTNEVGNVCFGYQAGLYLTNTAGNEGTYNVHIGYQSGYGSGGANTQKGYYNIGIGRSTLAANTTGYNCVAVGESALAANTTGDGNFALGTNALAASNTAVGCVAIGYRALASLNGNNSYNIAIGTQALDQTTGSQYNVVIGRLAGYGVTTGKRNIYIGAQAGRNMGAGDHNIGIGYEALNSSGTPTSYGNVAIGYHALRSIGTGANYNTSIGYISGYSITTGDYNVYLGHKAGYNQTTLSDRLIINNRDEGSAAAEITDSLIYGIFDATPANQSLRINGEILGSDGAKIGDAGTANYLAISATGDLDLYGTANNIENHTGDLTVKSAGSIYLESVTEVIKTGTDIGNCLSYLLGNITGTGATSVYWQINDDSDTLKLVRSNVAITKYEILMPVDIGDGTNYTSIASDGTITLAGTAKVTNAVWMPATGMKGVGAKAATFVEHGLSGAYQFTDGTDDQVVGSMRIPDRMDRSVAPTISIGWSSTAVVGNCNWQLEYLWRKADEDTTAIAQDTHTTAATVSGTPEGLVFTIFDALDLPDSDDLCLHFRLTREANNDPPDTLADTAELHGICMSFTSNKLGA